MFYFNVSVAFLALAPSSHCLVFHNFLLYCGHVQQSLIPAMFLHLAPVKKKRFILALKFPVQVYSWPTLLRFETLLLSPLWHESEISFCSIFTNLISFLLHFTKENVHPWWQNTLLSLSLLVQKYGGYTSRRNKWSHWVLLSFYTAS